MKPSNSKFKKTPREKKGMYVEVRYPPNPTEEQEHKAFTNAWRKFKKMVLLDGILQEYRDNQAYQKPSEKRNVKRAMAIKRERKRAKEAEAERWGDEPKKKKKKTYDSPRQAA